MSAKNAKGNSSGKKTASSSGKPIASSSATQIAYADLITKAIENVSLTTNQNTSKKQPAASSRGREINQPAAAVHAFVLPKKVPAPEQNAQSAQNSTKEPPVTPPRPLTAANLQEMHDEFEKQKAADAFQDDDDDDTMDWTSSSKKSPSQSSNSSHGTVSMHSVDLDDGQQDDPKATEDNVVAEKDESSHHDDLNQESDNDDDPLAAVDDISPEVAAKAAALAAAEVEAKEKAEKIATAKAQAAIENAAVAKCFTDASRRVYNELEARARAKSNDRYWKKMDQEAMAYDAKQDAKEAKMRRKSGVAKCLNLEAAETTRYDGARREENSQEVREIEKNDPVLIREKEEDKKKRRPSSK